MMIEKEEPIEGPLENETQDQSPEESSEFGQADVKDTPDSLQAQLTEERSKYLRLYAEFENFRKRSAKERLDLIGSSTADLMKELLPVMDDFERAITTNEEVNDIKAIKEGFELLHNKLFKILEAKGLQAMASKGETFDSELHEAIAQIPAPKKSDKGVVLEVVEKGYSLNEKVIRHPKVVVGS